MAMRVTIAGGGLVGLATARLLRARGVEAVVIERMQEADYVARGFMLGQQGHEALADLGLLEEVVQLGRPIAPRADGSCAAVAVEVGKVLALLAAGLPVRYGCSVAALHSEGGRVVGVEVEGPDGLERLESDLLVACDGVRSGVRSMAGLDADISPMAEGKIEWMSPVPVEATFQMEYLSNGGHIGLIGWPEGSFGWRTTERVGRAAALDPGLEALVSSWTALLPDAAAGVRGLTSIEQVHYSQPYLLTCREWWRPGVVLIGDAAHFFGPETGASAGIGLSDAHALAQAIAAFHDEADSACQAYVAWREPVARRYEAADPGRQRLAGSRISAPRPQERWPPA